MPTIEELYRNILGRDPDEGGLKYWQGYQGDPMNAFLAAAQLEKPGAFYDPNFGKTQQSTVDVDSGSTFDASTFDANKAFNVMGGLSATAPKDYTDLVTKTYQDVLGRSTEGDQGGLDYWKGQLSSGAITPDAFTSTFKSAAAPELAVQQLYQDVLGRRADTMGLSHWTNLIGSDGITPEERQFFINEAIAAGELKAPTTTTGAADTVTSQAATGAATTGADTTKATTTGAATTGTTTTVKPEDLVYDYQGKGYDKVQLLHLANQIAPNITSLAGGVFSTKGESVGFDYSEAQKILGGEPTAGQQVVLDMARNMLNMGITDLSQLNIKEHREDMEIFEILDDYGRPTGTYATTVQDPNNPESTTTRILTPDEVANIRTESVTGPDGESVRTFAEDVLTGRSLYSGDQLVNATNQITEGLSFDIGVTFTGPDSTRYKLIINPTTGKPEFTAYYSSTSDMDKVNSILTMASFVPQLAVFAKSLQAAIAIRSGDVIGGLANLAGANGFDNVATGLKVANAVKNGDVVQLATALVNNSEVMKAAGDIKIAGDISLKDVGNGIKLADAVANQKWSDALNIAGVMSQSSDLVTAAAGTKMMEAVMSGNPLLIASAGLNLSKVTGAANNITDTKVAGDIVNSVKNTQVASLDSSVTGTATDAIGDALDTTVGGSGTDTMAGTTVSADDVNAEDTFTGLDQLSVDTFIAAKNAGASDEDALAAANSVLTSSKGTVDEFGGFGDAAKETAARTTLTVGNTEADSPGEAAALAAARGFTNFTYGGKTYSLSGSTDEINRQVTNQEIASQTNFADAYKLARETLGAGKTFEWNGKSYSTDTREENPALAAASDALRASLNKTVDTPADLDKAVKSVDTPTTYGGPTILGVRIGTPQDALNTVKRMGEVVTDFSRGIGEGFGNFLNSVGTLGHIVSASIQGGDTKNAVIARNNVLSTMGKNISGYYEGLTTDQSKQEWKNIVAAVDAAPDYLKPIVAVTATLQNFGGFVNKVGGELGEEVVPIATGLTVGTKVLQLGASGTAKTIGVTATVGDMAESASGSYDTVMKRVENNPNMTDAEKHWAGTQAAATSMVATAVFGYGANAYLAKSLVGDMIAPAAQKVLGPAAVEYVTEMPETYIQSLGEKFAEKGSINAKDISDANTDASISALIGAKTAGTITGTVQVMGMVSNGFVGAGDSKGGIAIVQNEQGQIGLVPAGDLKQGQTFDISEVQQLDTPADVVSQFNFSPEDASRITESVQGLVDTKSERDAKSAEEAASFDPSSIDLNASLLHVASPGGDVTATPSGVSLDTKAGTQTTTQEGVTTSTSTDSKAETDTTTTSDANTGVNTQTVTNTNTGTNTVTTTDTNTGTTTQTTTNTQTNTTTETTSDTSNNTLTQVTTDSNTNTSTTTQINNNTNVTTQVTTDTNTSTETSVVTDQNNNTQTTTTVDTDTGEVTSTVTTDIPDDWEPPVIDPPPPVETVVTTTTDPKKEPPKKETPKKQTKRSLSDLGPLVLGAPAIYPDDGPKFKDPFITSKDKQRKFVGSLDPFFEEVESGSMITPEFGVPAPVELQDQTETKEETMPNYFTYGMETDLDRLFGPTGTNLSEFDNGEDQMAAAAGGLATPLMASGGLTRYGRYAGGGLPLVAHSGKTRVDFRQGDAVTGAGDGQSDDIPAMLADGEFVIPADVVAALGNGSTKAGSDKLYDMMHSIRAYHRSAKPKDLPPPAKASPLDYLKKTSRKARR